MARSYGTDGVARWTGDLFARGSALFAGGLLIAALAGWTHRNTESIDPLPEVGVAPAADELAAELTGVRGDVAAIKQQLDRANAIVDYSTRYQIPADLAASIYDIALAEGIDPAVAFRLVKVESNFIRDAKSSAGALGYTQLRLGTARFYQANLTEAQLMDRDVNLRIGFRFLNDLMQEFGDPHLALLAYNRGPARVNAILAQGGDPANGYSDAVLHGTRIAPTPPVAAQ